MLLLLLLLLLCCVRDVPVADCAVPLKVSRQLPLEKLRNVDRNVDLQGWSRQHLRQHQCEHGKKSHACM
jgi:hypothetical protein